MLTFFFHLTHHCYLSLHFPRDNAYINPSPDDFLKESLAAELQWYFPGLWAIRIHPAILVTVLPHSCKPSPIPFFLPYILNLFTSVHLYFFHPSPSLHHLSPGQHSPDWSLYFQAYPSLIHSPPSSNIGHVCWAMSFTSLPSFSPSFPLYRNKIPTSRTIAVEKAVSCPDPPSQKELLLWLLGMLLVDAFGYQSFQWQVAALSRVAHIQRQWHKGLAVLVWRTILAPRGIGFSCHLALNISSFSSLHILLPSLFLQVLI